LVVAKLWESIRAQLPIGSSINRRFIIAAVIYKVSLYPQIKAHLIVLLIKNTKVKKNELEGMLTCRSYNLPQSNSIFVNAN